MGTIIVITRCGKADNVPLCNSTQNNQVLDTVKTGHKKRMQVSDTVKTDHKKHANLKHGQNVPQ